MSVHITNNGTYIYKKDFKPSELEVIKKNYTLFQNLLLIMAIQRLRHLIPLPKQPINYIFLNIMLSKSLILKILKIQLNQIIH